jgi:hypothetical protein
MRVSVYQDKGTASIRTRPVGVDECSLQLVQVNGAAPIAVYIVEKLPESRVGTRRWATVTQRGRWRLLRMSIPSSRMVWVRRVVPVRIAVRSISTIHVPMALVVV